MRGFTLVELLVVIAITSILMSLVLASLNGARKAATAAAECEQFGSTRLRDAEGIPKVCRAWYLDR